MTTNTDALREYFRTRDKSRVAAEAAQTALASLAPFDKIDGSRGYPLVRGAELDVGSLASAMWTAFKLPMNRCAYLHAKVPLTELPWTEESARLNELIIAKYADRCAWNIECDPAFDKAFAAAVGDRLEAALDLTLASSGLLASGIPSRMLRSVLRMRTALYASASPEAKNLDPLADILLRAIPVANSARKRGEWFVVVQ